MAILGAMLAASPVLGSETSERDAVKQVVAAVQAGDNLIDRFPGAVSETEAQSLKRVAACKAHNVMRQPKGHWTVVWGCKDGGMLGMQVNFKDGMISQISTMELVRRPHVESH